MMDLLICVLRRTTPLFDQRRLAKVPARKLRSSAGAAALGCPGPSPVEHPFGRVATELLCRVLDDSQALCVTRRRSARTTTEGCDIHAWSEAAIILCCSATHRPAARAGCVDRSWTAAGGPHGRHDRRCG